jgi:hypothetical protein
LYFYVSEGDCPLLIVRSPLSVSGQWSVVGFEILNFPFAICHLPFAILQTDFRFLPFAF